MIEQHDDEEIVATLRAYILAIRQCDAESAEIDRRRRDVYRQARDFGFNTDAIKQIARQKHPGQAQAEANDLIAYLSAIAGTEAAGRLKRESFSEIAFGTYKWPSEMADQPFGDYEE
jgi:uncharacterized protein (UPF0335 family)